MGKVSIEDMIAGLELVVSNARSAMVEAARLDALRADTAKAKREKDAAESELAAVTAQASRKIKDAAEDCERRCAEYKAELVRRNEEARATFAQWETSSKAKKQRIDQSIQVAQEQLNGVKASLAEAERELAAIHDKLDAARHAYKQALTGVGA